MGKLALITGATSGIGSAFAMKYAQMGYDLLITGRRKEKIKNNAKNIRKKFNVQVEVYIIELSNIKEVDNFIDYISDKEISVLINNAGFGLFKNYHEEEISKWENMLDVHVRVPMKLAHTVIPKMIEKNEGVIINVSSLNAFLVFPKISIYSSTKAFIKNFSEVLNMELKEKGIKVQTLCPGFTKSNFHEKMGIDISKRKGLLWMTSQKVVEKSIKCVEKSKVICIPGVGNKLMTFLLRLLPKNIYYKLVSKKFIKEDINK